jgi:ATP-binding cassette subfamily B protein
VLLADKILLLDQGRIAAIGTHQQLLAANSMYRDIYRSQLGEPPGEKVEYNDG